MITYQVRFDAQDDVIPAGHVICLRAGAADDWVQPDGTHAQITLVLARNLGTRPARLAFVRGAATPTAAQGP